MAHDRIDYDIKQPGEGWETEAERQLSSHDTMDYARHRPWQKCVPDRRKAGSKKVVCSDAASPQMWEKRAGRAMDCGPSRERTPRAVCVPFIVSPNHFFPLFTTTPVSVGVADLDSASALEGSFRLPLAWLHWRISKEQDHQGSDSPATLYLSYR